MSLSRAFTTRRNKNAEATRTIRHKISAPLELVSTTNMLSYNAPDIYPNAASPNNNYNYPKPLVSPHPSSAASTNSDRDSSSDRSVATPLTSPETSSIESSPTSLEPNHLSCYFGQNSHRSASDSEAPVIPKRAPSHTKKNSVIMARQRSFSHHSNQSHRSQQSQQSLPSRKNSTSTARSSRDMFTTDVETLEPQHLAASNNNPFGQELAQVSEIAEEYGISQETLTIVDEEEQELTSKGLFKFGAEDYMSEIQGLLALAFGESHAKPAMSRWI